MSGFVPVPHEALEALPIEHWHAVVDLFKRAHALRWKPFSITQDSLATRWKVSTRQVWIIIDALVEHGWATVEKGSNRTPSRITLVCPTAELHNASMKRSIPLENLHRSGHRTGHHNSSPPTPTSEERVSQSVPQSVPTLTRPETETRDRDEERAPSALPLQLSEPKASRKRTAKPKEPKAKPADYSKPFTDAWSAVWKETRGGGYPWDWWKDRTLILRAAGAAGAPPDGPPDAETIARFERGVRAYLAAAAAGTAWPPGPPTVQGFTVRVAEWLLADTSRTYTRGDHPGVPALDAKTIAELYAGTDPLNPEF